MMAARARRRLARLAAPMRQVACADDEQPEVHVHWHLPASIKEMTPEQLAALTRPAAAAADALALTAAPPQPPPPQQQGRERRRLTELGRRASIEVSPAQAGAPPRAPRPGEPAPAGLKFTLAQEMDRCAAEGGRPPLPPGAVVFVNMVKTNEGHFEDVVAAVQALSSRGIAPVPHLPACRFDSAAAVAPTLRRLRDAGSTHALLLLGGNDQQERAEAGAPYGGADALLESGSVSAAAAGVGRIMIAGHPEGHPGLGFDKRKTAELLERKVRAAVIEQGYTEVTIVSQLCFDPPTLLEWLHSTRTQLAGLVGAIEAETAASQQQWPTAATAAAPASAEGVGGASVAPSRVRLRYYVGVPGPTAAGRLKRVAQICEVASPTMAKLMQVGPFHFQFQQRTLYSCSS